MSARFFARRQAAKDFVAEGVYIAAAAVRLTVKNRILVDILSHQRNFDAEHFLPVAREALLSLADEAQTDSERTGKERKMVRGVKGDSTGTHDYRSRDSRNLRRRAQQSEYIAQELRSRAEDETQLHRLVEAARDAAWHELSRNIDRSLVIVASRPDQETDYQKMRGARMQALRLVDLPKLAAHRRNFADTTQRHSETDSTQ